MREILFRGKRKDNGEWVEGIPMRTNSTEIGIGKKITFMNVVPWTDKRKGKILAYFDPKNCPAIDDNTICQYTGLTDKNGTKIFEGDIVKGKSEYFGNGSLNQKAVVLYDRGQFLLSFGETFEECKQLNDFEVVGVWNGDVEVIGNVHDNPELLNK